MTPIEQLSRGVRRIPAVDLTLSAAVLLVAVIEASFISDYGVHLVYVLNVAIHLVLVPATALRRTRVVGAFIASYAALAALALLIRFSPVNLGVSPVLFCAPLALLAVTRHGPSPRWGWAALLLGVVGSFASPVRGWQTQGTVLVVALHILLLVGCYLWAAQQRSLADSHTRELAEQQLLHQQRTAEKVAGERVLIAREVHDIVAHNLAVVQVQAATALAIDRPERQREALVAIREVASGALRETRSLVGVLRTEDPVEAHSDAVSGPTGELGEVPNLVARARKSGVRLSADLPDAKTLHRWQTSWPARTRLTVLRVVQESLTNVIKHGGEEPSAELRLAVEADEVVLEVTNQLRSPRGTPGFGLAGLQERVQLSGGRLTAGEWGTGFRVLARIPLNEEEGEQHG